MDNKNINKFSDRRVGGKQLIVPFIAIIMFIIITAGTSFAYFTFWGASNNVNLVLAAWGNQTGNYPSRYDRKCQAAAQSSTCSITVTYKNMANGQVGQCFTSSNCSLKVNVTGLAGDSVSYNVGIKKVSGTVPSGYTLSAGEFVYAGDWSGDLKDVSTTGTILQSGRTVSVSADGGTATSYANISVKFCNINKNQTLLLGTAASTYTWQLYTSGITCSLPNAK